jgi:electron transfer flavoprotein beta subunit
VKIAVPVKWVASLDDEFELLGDTAVDPDTLEWELNEWDLFSLEAALQLRDAAGEGSEVMVITVGDSGSEEGLLACLARGADRAIRVTDEALDGADSLAIARVLAAVLGAESPDLVLCGAQSADATAAATGMALAGLLGLGRVAVVRRIEAADGDGALIVDRELEGGLAERLRIALPAVLTIQTGLNQPRYANIRGLQAARSKPMEVRSLAEVGLSGGEIEAARGSRRRKLASPEAGGSAEMLSGAPDEIADRIAQIVKERLGA